MCIRDRASGNGVSCTVGDFDNDGLPDVAVAMSDRVLLFKNSGGGKFTDVTTASGVQPANHPAGITFVDYDHDGDLDLFVTGRPSAPGSKPNVLWRNNGNGTFTNWTEQAGLGGDGTTVAATLSDLNNDRAVDLLVTGSGPAPTFFANPREGLFKSSPLFAAEGLPPTVGAVAVSYTHLDVYKRQVRDSPDQGAHWFVPGTSLRKSQPKLAENGPPGLTA